MWIWSILLHIKSWWYQKKYIIFKKNNGCWIFQNPWKDDISATVFSYWNHHSRKACNVRVGKKVVWNLVPSKHRWCLTAHTETVLRTELQNSGWLTLLLLPPAEQAWLSHGQFNKMNHPSLTLPERYDLHICPWGAPWFCQWNDCPLTAHWYCFIHALHFFLKLLSPVCFQGDEYVCSDMSYTIPKEIKLSLVICIDFPLPAKISFKSIAICRKTEDRTDNWWIIFNAFFE